MCGFGRLVFPGRCFVGLWLDYGGSGEFKVQCVSELCEGRVPACDVLEDLSLVPCYGACGALVCDDVEVYEGVGEVVV